MARKFHPATKDANMMQKECGQENLENIVRL